MVPESVDDHVKVQKKQKERLYGGIFLGCVSLASVIGGFSIALGRTKKTDPKSFGVQAEAAGLASRALGWGSLYAVLGVGTLSFVAAKALGVHSLEEFRLKMESAFSGLPTVKRGEGRSDFASFRELFTFLEKGGADAPPKH